MWLELISKEEISSLKTQLDDLKTRVETLEGGGN